MMSTRLCRACAQPLRDVTAFCPHCGARQGAATARTRASSPTGRRIAAALIDTALILFVGSLLEIIIAMPLLRVVERSVFINAVYATWLVLIWLYSVGLERRTGM